MTEIAAVVDNLDLPERTRSATPFDKLQVGQAFIFDNVNEKKLRSIQGRVSNYRKRNPLKHISTHLLKTPMEGISLPNGLTYPVLVVKRYEDYTEPRPTRARKSSEAPMKEVA